MNRETFLRKLKLYGEANDIPNISEINAVFLRNILREKKVQHMLEIGTANGYSTIHFALELEKISGKIDTIEFSQLSYEMAQDNFEQAKVDHLISQYFWDAREILPLLDKNYDFVFIDGLKKASLDFLLLVWNKVPVWGTIVIDDVIKFRYKMENLYTYLSEQNIDFQVIQIDPDDGIMIIEKK